MPDDGDRGLPRWVWNAMAAACLSSPHRTRGAHFSEYGLYSTFVFSRHPESVLSGSKMRMERHFDNEKHGIGWHVHDGTIGAAIRERYTGSKGACIDPTSFLQRVRDFRKNYTVLGFDVHDGDKAAKKTYMYEVMQWLHR